MVFATKPTDPASLSPERVRLVIWDLDETFWKGTLTEGGIQSYIAANHDAVMRLAERGIVSSICSKNDRSSVEEILNEIGLLNYFVFSSISWDSKAARVAEIIKSSGLRPESVMFIDDNPINREEVKSYIPGIQIEDEHFCAKMLDDYRFVGKKDPSLSRLSHYRVLDEKASARKHATGDSFSFLRTCDIKVLIEYDVERYIDRAVELINRTNQLNFTKNRLPEESSLAIDQLLIALRKPGRQSGLIRIVDKYGDYGFVGFYLMRNGRNDVVTKEYSNNTLEHYCFSCRTLGMLVETWVFQWLHKPALQIVGDVVTDIHAEMDIDWIRIVHSFNHLNGPSSLVTEIRVYGGCEANTIGHFLNVCSKKVFVNGNFPRGPLFFRINSAAILTSITLSEAKDDLSNEMRTLGVPSSLFGEDVFTSAPFGTVFIFSLGLDAEALNRYRHKIHNWEFRVEINGIPKPDLLSISADDLARQLDRIQIPAERVYAQAVITHLRQNYTSVAGPRGAEVVEPLERLIKRIPIGSKLIIVLDHNQVRSSDGSLVDAVWVERYNNIVCDVVQRYSFAQVAKSSQAIRNDNEIKPGGNHYDRMVYHRLSEIIISCIEDTQTRNC